MTVPSTTTWLADHTRQQLEDCLREMTRLCAFALKLLARDQGVEATPSLPYTITLNGEPHQATETEVEALRRTWTGHFLLDLPRMILRVSTGEQPEELGLEKGKLHRGVAAVFHVGMSRPGARFTARDVKRARRSTKATFDHSILRCYVCKARGCIGDSGRSPQYLLTVPAGKVVSETPWAYLFDPAYEYALIETNAEQESPGNPQPRPHG